MIKNYSSSKNASKSSVFFFALFIFFEFKICSGVKSGIAGSPGADKVSRIGEPARTGDPGDERTFLLSPLYSLRRISLRTEGISRVVGAT
jgi:hypothetical protein